MGVGMVVTEQEDDVQLLGVFVEYVKDELGIDVVEGR